MITSKVILTQPLGTDRQFAATTGSAHHMLLDDAAGGHRPQNPSSSLLWDWPAAQLSTSLPSFVNG